MPSLSALEKRVHVTDSSLLMPQAMVEYAVPDDVPVHDTCQVIGLRVKPTPVHREMKGSIKPPRSFLWSLQLSCPSSARPIATR